MTMCVNREDFTDFREEVRLGLQDIGGKIGGIQKDTSLIESHLEKQNGRIRRVEQSVTTLRSAAKRKALDCPYKETIEGLLEVSMTASVLRDYIDQKNKALTKRLGVYVAVMSMVIALAALMFS